MKPPAESVAARRSNRQSSSPVATIPWTSTTPEPGEAYARVEGPRGELGFYVVSDGGAAPFRFHIRAPSLINLSLLRQMAIGASLPDAIVTLGSIDINVGEIDR